MPCRCPWNLRRFFPLLLLATGYGFAQDSTQTYPVNGIVLNSVTHEPIPRALVEEQSDAALTDSNGRFELQLPAQTVTITARRPGFDVQNQGGTRTIQVSANTPEVTFQLNPQALITGHIEMPDEADAAGIQIMAYRARMRHGARIWEFAGAAVARSDGSFRLVPPQVGTFMLRTSPLAENNGRLAEPANDTAKVFGYPAASYPAAQQSSDSGLRLARGQQVNINLVLTRQEFHAVAIEVRGLPNGVPPGFQLFDENGTPMQQAIQWNSQSHQASARLPDGQYSVVAELNGQTSLFGRIDFQVAGAPPTGLSVTVLPLLPIAVNVHRNFSEKPPPILDRVAGAGEILPSDTFGISVGLESVNGQAGGASRLERPPASSDNSSLQLTGTQPGRYWVQVYPQEGYASTITSGGIDLEREPLVVGPGGASQPIEITVRNDPGQIGCTVRSSVLQNAAAGDSPPIAFVYAIPQAQTTQMPPQMGAPLNMEASMTPVPPGTYRVIALDQSINIDDVDKDDLNRYLRKGQTVTVEAGGKATVTLSISHVNDANVSEDASQD